MDATGIICEYNPLHLGHKKQLDMIKTAYPSDAIVCLMSGNYVQRGHPAILDKSLRAQAAILCGADLVLELPIAASLSSAEGFAREGVRILSSICSRLCFGSETANTPVLIQTAETLLSPAFSAALRQQLDEGLSFPAARQAALQSMGVCSHILSQPNDILAIEYCKAILEQNLSIEPVSILREGSYHARAIDEENPSATALRDLMATGKEWLKYVPEEARSCLSGATQHMLSAAEQAILYRLRTMTAAEFEALPFGSEGLWRKLMHNCQGFSTLEEILTATKSKRYTRTRLDRMVMCAFLGLTQTDLSSPAPYVRVLALNQKGRTLLRNARNTGMFSNAGDVQKHPYQELENRVSRLYSLFSAPQTEPIYCEEDRRVFYWDTRN